MKSEDVKILIVDDHTLFREGVKFVIGTIEGFKCIGEADNGQDCIRFISKELPDVVLMDISMPQMDGIETTSYLSKNYPEIRILVLSSYGDDVYYKKMIKSGAHGFISKNAPKEEIEKALRMVANGESYFPTEILSEILKQKIRKYDEPLESLAFKLTKRENEILLLICKGNSNNEIAEILCISPKTVDNHRTNILSKTGSRNSASLVMFAVNHRLVDLNL